MSVVKLLYTDAKCPKCGVEAVEIFDRYLQPGETVELCDCGVELEYTPVSCYQAVCDRCGEHVTDYGDWCAIGPTLSDMWECLPDWLHLNGRDLCEDCWWVDDNDEVVERPPLIAKTGDSAKYAPDNDEENSK